MLQLFAALIAGAAFYQLFFALMGHLYSTPFSSKKEGRNRRIGVLMAAYREDGVIVQTAQASAMQYYPAADFEVVVIADSLRPDTLTALRKMPVTVIEVAFEKSTKSRALRAALAQLPEYDAVVVLDADNFMHPDFLQRINSRLEEGWLAIQGQRSHKNQNTGFALLDGLSEWVNNHILCKGHSVLGLSARLAGSGMAFEYRLFREVMETVDAIGGFDKELEGKITARGARIRYDHGAMIYDEKVSKSGSFAKQRGRWLAAQYTYAGRFAGGAFRGLLHGNVDHFNKFLQMTLPPRLLLPIVLLLGTLFSPGANGTWLAGLAASCASFALAIPVKLWTNPMFWNGLFQIPLAVFATFRALAWMPAARKTFLHTEHV